MKILTISLSVLAGVQLLLLTQQSSSATSEKAGSNAHANKINSTKSGRLTSSMVGPDSNVFFCPPHDSKLNHLPQKYTEETGASEPGEEFIDHLGNHHWYRTPKPFAVTKSTENFQWTDEDGRSPEVMAQLANNSLMLEDLERRNAFVNDRKLLYVSEEFGPKAHEIFHGNRDELILPGPDGKEFRVKVNQFVADETGENAHTTGAFSGQIVGQPNSYIEAGAQEDFWSISITTNDNKVYEILTREQGEWIFSEIDPAARQEHDDFGCGVNYTDDDVGTVQEN